MRATAGLPTAILLGLTLAGCGSDPTDPRPGTTTPAVVARFEIDGDAVPRFLDVPFPSDVYLEADGTLVDVIPGFDAYVTRNAAALEATLARQRGFGVNAGAVFRIERPRDVDPITSAPVSASVDADSLPGSEDASLAGDAAVMLIDLDATSPASARVPCRAAFHDDRPNGAESPPVLAVVPARGVVLAEKHRYAAVLTTAVTADGGEAVAASADFASIRDAESHQGAIATLYGDAVTRAGELVPWLEDRSRIAALTVFTTQASSGELVAMRAIVAALPPPALDWDPRAIAPMHAAVFATAPGPGVTATLDDWLGAPAKLPDGGDDPAWVEPGGAAHDSIAAIATAVYETPNFLRSREMGYLDPEHATIAFDDTGAPILDPDRPTVKSWITIILPKGPVPAAGYPVVILQHGLQSDRSFLLALANTFAKQGWASVGIDAVTFGARSAHPENTTDEASVFPWSASAGYAGPDGLVDVAAKATAFLGDFWSFGAMRDQLRHAALDIGSLAEVVANPALDLGPLAALVPGAKLDGARIGYVSDSFGSVVGAMAAAVEPRIGTFVLNVGGGGLATEVLSRAPGIAPLVNTAGGLNYGFTGDRFDWSHPVTNLLQSILDPGDPLTHARGIVIAPAMIGGVPNAPKNVILIEALWDELVVNESSEALARAAGMPLAAPNVGPNGGVPLATAELVDGAIRGVPLAGATAVLVQASPATHGCDLYCRSGVRHFAIPFGQPGPTPFPVLPKDIPVEEPYLALQGMTVSFLADAFAGAVPAVKGAPAPVRDFDDDGVPDEMDTDPFDPAK